MQLLGELNSPTNGRLQRKSSKLLATSEAAKRHPLCDGFVKEDFWQPIYLTRAVAGAFHPGSSAAMASQSNTSRRSLDRFEAPASFLTQKDEPLVGQRLNGFSPAMPFWMGDRLQSSSQQCPTKS
ncbi:MULTISPECIES: hypothetical protein [Stenotrophomonas]|uniref:hypothetical protein n=1 Tax=Stenotrophomonas TaxID=40323 RepID=UPI0010645573|nr:MULTISPECIES: hypothetical protein [Stenotrophomonas]MBY6282310.1 hypothetical protein [Stenotrophomonas maltophilia]